MTAIPSSRETYRHGGLREALIEVGVELARTGGPDAVVLRETTRRTGVAPNAAYRHFADRQELLRAVSDRAQALAATRIEERLRGLGGTGDAGEDARALIRAIGHAYVDFARAEPGLFRAAFTVPRDLVTAGSRTKAGSGGRTPFQLLARALDALVEAGLLPPERRPGAEFCAWSAVHGLAMLVLEGPLHALDEAAVVAARDRVVEAIVRGL